MKKKLNTQLISIAALAMVTTLLLMLLFCYNSFRQNAFSDLATLSRIMISMHENNSWEHVGEVANEDNIRLTILDQEGTVLYDNKADPQTMSNHIDRPEIMEALGHQVGKADRQSETLNKRTFYYASMLEDGSVLRIARETKSIFFSLFEYVYLLVILLVFLLILCGGLSIYFTKSIVDPLKKLANEEGALQKADFIKTGYIYPELKPFLEAMATKQEQMTENALMRQQFTANVSHELKTPLTAISGYAELIENGMVPDEKDQKRFATEIHKNAERLLTLINDIIRLTELDQREADVEPEKINLFVMAKECVRSLEMNAKKHHVTIQATGENAFIMADRNMMEELLSNLCDNAIRYNRENGTVTVQVLDRLDHVELVVTDTGIGIPLEHREHIFERFYRVDKGRSKSTGGTGLGLAIVKHILIKHHTSAQILSEVGKGTEIHVRFDKA
ncbi:MAG: two-component sensor histidine kinase [Clostridia bacterium]|nr:two-component sensor histidine kinase [Clostridia bacterium]